MFFKINIFAVFCIVRLSQAAQANRLINQKNCLIKAIDCNVTQAPSDSVTDVNIIFPNLKGSNLEIITDPKSDNNTGLFQFMFKQNAKIKEGDVEILTIDVEALNSSICKFGSIVYVSCFNPKTGVYFFSQIDSSFKYSYLIITIPINKEFKDTVISVKTLGLIDKIELTESENLQIDISFYSKILRKSPVKQTYALSNTETAVRTNNQSTEEISLAETFAKLNKALKKKIVTSKDINKMACGIFVDKIKNIIKDYQSNQTLVDTNFGIYCKNYSNCIQNLSFFENTSGTNKCLLPKPNSFAFNPFCTSVMNSEIAINQFNVEALNLFGEVLFQRGVAKNQELSNE